MIGFWRCYFILASVLLVWSIDISEITYLDTLHLKNYKIGCPGRGPLTTVNSCVIVCESHSCENAKRICKELGEDCNVVVRARAGSKDTLHGQVVELKRVGPDTRLLQNKKACLQYGKQLSTTALGKRVAANTGRNAFAINQFVARNGTMMFLHMRKAGGTTLCNLAKKNKLGVYNVGKDKREYVASSMGKNCNPAYSDMNAWFGTIQQQLDWIRRYRIQFYGNEAQLSRENDIPFGLIVTGTQFRHPLSRLYSLFLENSNVEPSVFSLSRISSHGDDSIRALSERVQRRYESFVSALNDVRIRSGSTSDWLQYTNAAGVNLSSEGSIPAEGFYREVKARNFTKYLQLSYRNQDLAFFVGMKEYEKDETGEYIKTLPSRELLKTKRYQAYTESDFDNAVRILEKFTFVSVIEGVSFLMKNILNDKFKLKQYDPDQHQRGTIKKRLGFEAYGHDRSLINTFLAASNFDILLYTHATAISCLQYYYNSMNTSDVLAEDRPRKGKSRRTK